MDKKELIVGRNPVMEYLRSDKSCTCLYISEKAHGKIIDQLKGIAKGKKIHVEKKPKDFFTKLGSSTNHQGVALETRKKREAISSDLITDLSNSNSVLVILDHLTDPHNVGSIIRSAEALGAQGILITENQSADITAIVVKSSAGATAHIPIKKINNIAQSLEKAKKLGWWTVGTTDHGTSQLEELKDIRPLIIVIGSEGTGMKRLTEEKCDYLVKIPLKGQISSLNASVAAGIVLYEVLK
jgi:23S rRNA (guanosine2251-2'-O)-methyltransferase